MNDYKRVFSVHLLKSCGPDHSELKVMKEDEKTLKISRHNHLNTETASVRINQTHFTRSLSFLNYISKIMTVEESKIVQKKIFSSG